MNKNFFNFKNREEKLVFLLTFLFFSNGDDIDFNAKFFHVLGDLVFSFIIIFILTFIFYHLVTRPIYRWLVKNGL